MARTRHMYFPDLVALSHEFEAGGKLQIGATERGRGAKIMKGYSGLFAKMSFARKAVYDRKVVSHIDAKTQELQDKKKAAFIRKATLTERIAEDESNDGEYRDLMNTKGGWIFYEYEVCEAGSTAPADCAQATASAPG